MLIVCGFPAFGVGDGGGAAHVATPLGFGGVGGGVGVAEVYELQAAFFICEYHLSFTFSGAFYRLVDGVPASAVLHATAGVGG